MNMPHRRRRFGANRVPPPSPVTTTQLSSTGPVKRGRWSLRCTKSRQNRVCVTTAPRKRSNKRKRTLQSPAHSSCSENDTPLPDDVRTNNQGGGGGGGAPPTSEETDMEAFDDCLLWPYKDPYSIPNCIKILNTMDLPWALL